MATEKDIVLIYFEDQPMAFARIEDITADVKPGWYVVKLLFLQIPVDVVHWILRDSYIDGAEFTMNGKKMRLEKVVCPDEAEVVPLDDDKKTSAKSEKKNASSNDGGQVISLSDRFKR